MEKEEFQKTWKNQIISFSIKQKTQRFIKCNITTKQLIQVFVQGLRQSRTTGQDL